jgi:UDP-glucuronate 4-epimerase
MEKKVLVTGSAGFIGFHLVKALLTAGYDVVGIDNLNDYYDPQLKQDRLNNLDEFVKDRELSGHYEFMQLDISDHRSLDQIFENFQFHIVVNLAAQAGVRYSLENPRAYVKSNLVGFANILECCRDAKIEHLLFASSSSVYGMNIKQPFSVLDNTDFPVSLYAATKKSNELLAHSYSHLFNMPCTGLRFFTVYGPFGRPDMAYYSFTKAIDNDISIDIYNNGDMERDFTYIDDAVEAVMRLAKKAPQPQVNKITGSKAPFKVFNVGNNSPVSLSHFVETIESSMGKVAIKNYLPMQAGDVPKTFACVDELIAACDFQPSTSLEEGIHQFVHWYKSSSDASKKSN